MPTTIPDWAAETEVPDWAQDTTPDWARTVTLVDPNADRAQRISTTTGSTAGKGLGPGGSILESIKKEPTPDWSGTVASAVFPESEPEQSLVGLDPANVPAGQSAPGRVVRSVERTALGLGQFMTSPKGVVQTVASLTPARLLVMAGWAHDMAAGAGQSAGNLSTLITKPDKTPEDWQQISDDTVNTVVSLAAAGKLGSDVGAGATGIRSPVTRFIEAKTKRLSKDLAVAIDRAPLQMPGALPVPGINLPVPDWAADRQATGMLVDEGNFPLGKGFQTPEGTPAPAPDWSTLKTEPILPDAAASLEATRTATPEPVATADAAQPASTPATSSNIGGRAQAPSEPVIKTPPVVEPSPPAAATAPAAPAASAGVPPMATIPELPPATTAIDPAHVPTVEFPLKDLALSKDVPNFKAGASETTGTVAGQELAGKYQRTGTAPIVVWQRLNGDNEVITGRPRFDLAKRSGEKTIPAQVVREQDGFTKDMALTFDAEANIRDGQGDTSDYANYFKNTAISEAEARARGLLSRAKGQAGWSLAKAASDDVYALWRDGKINDAQAVAIANSAPGDAAAQQIGSKFALAGKSADFLSNVIKASKAEAGQRAQSLDLFGNDDSAMKAMADQAEKASQFQREIRSRIQVLTAGKKSDIARSEGIDVKNPAAIPDRINALKSELDRWQNWPLQPDLVAKVKSGKPPVANAGKIKTAEPAPKVETGAKDVKLAKLNLRNPLTLFGAIAGDAQTQGIAEGLAADRGDVSVFYTNARSGSIYVKVVENNTGETVTIRFADHFAPGGGGFRVTDMGSGREAPPDFNIVKNKIYSLENGKWEQINLDKLRWHLENWFPAEKANAPVAEGAAGIKTPLETQSQRAEAQADKGGVAAWQPEGTSALTEQSKPQPTEPVKPQSKELFSAAETPFNLSGETQKFVEPSKSQTAFGGETLTQHDMFAIADITKEVDPFKSANAAEKMYGGAAAAAVKLRNQLRVMDLDPEVKRSFTKDQRNRLAEVLNVLNQKAAAKPGRVAGGGEIIGMGGAVPGEFSPPDIASHINPALREGMARVGGPEATRTPTQSFLSRITTLLTRPDASAELAPLGKDTETVSQHIRGWLGTVSGRTMPKTTLRDRLAGELGGRYAASSAAAAPMGDLFANDVLAGLDISPARFDAALKADNLLSVKDGYEAEAARLAAEGDARGAATAGENAAAVNTMLGTKNFPFKNEAELQAYFKEPQVAEAIRRHRENWDAVVDPMYRDAAGIDPSIELPSRGRYSQARINLNPVREGEYKPESGTVVGARPSGTLTGTFQRKTPFARRATGTGEQYVLNYPATIANTFAKQLEIANKRAFDERLVKSGHAVIDDVGKTVRLPDGGKTKAFPLIRRGFVNKNIYVRESLAKEYAHAASVVLNPYRGNVLVGMNQAFARAALAGLTDATVHIGNLGTAMFQVPGSSGAPLLVDALLSGAGRLDVPAAIVRSGLKGVGEFGKTDLFQNRVSKYLPQSIVDSVNKSLLKNMAQMASIAQINAGRTPHGSRVVGFKQLGHAVQGMDRLTRMVLDDAYNRLARDGWVKDTETNRREFVNQAGSYNLRTQGEWMRFLRQTWISPFATAGRNFAVLGVRGVTLHPGVEAASLKAAAAMRVNMAAKWIGTAVLVGTLNYLINGQIQGLPGTPMGSISFRDKDGKVKYFNVAAFTGQTRALRTVGLSGYMETKRLGLSNTDAATTGVRDVVNTYLGATAGPGIRAAMIAGTGYPSAINVGRVSPVVPPGGFQPLANLKQALEDANPVVAGYFKYHAPGGTLAHALATQAPRFTLQPGKAEDLVANYPRIVSMAQANDFTEDMIRGARKVPMDGGQRVEFVASQIRLLPPELQAKAWSEVKRRAVFKSQ